MSLTRIPSQERLYKKPIHRRKDSGELDVFEATMYYCETTNAADLNTPKTMRQVLGGRRMSLDMNMRNPPPPPPPLIRYNPRSNEKQSKEKKHYKQPSSPGARLASFLNSLFNQKALKKKKSKSTTESVIEEEGSMRRRSSVSHFGSLWTTDSTSRNSSSSSGFQTPPSYAKNQTKVYKDLRKYSDNHKLCININREVSSMTYSSSSISVLHQDKNNILVDHADQKRKNMDLSWLDEKLKLIEKKKLMMNSNNGGSLFKKDRIWVDDEHDQEMDEEEDDDGGESDSSSDLFELQNCDLGLYSSGLPVYETTHIETIKRGTTITSTLL